MRWLHGIRAQVVVTVPGLSLLGADTAPAELDGYGPIDLHTARILAGRAKSFVPVLTRPETGATQEWKVRQAQHGSGELTWTAPTGREYVTVAG